MYEWVFTNGAVHLEDLENPREREAHVLTPEDGLVLCTGCVSTVHELAPDDAPRCNACLKHLALDKAQREAAS